MDGDMKLIEDKSGTTTQPETEQEPDTHIRLFVKVMTVATGIALGIICVFSALAPAYIAWTRSDTVYLLLYPAALALILISTARNGRNQ